MTDYFKNIDNILDANAKYKELAKKFHPDAGGSDEEFQILQQQYTNKKKNLTSKREKFKTFLKAAVESPFFDDYILPGLQKSQSRYASVLLNNENLIKFLSSDEDERKFYAEILKNQVENFDLKAFLRKILD